MTYKVQIDDEVRDATPAEAAAINAARADAEAQAQVMADKAAAAASGRAKLAALGLTNDEINALLGA
jgi:hypothetical protein